jgi:hypothetical protein
MARVAMRQHFCNSFIVYDHFRRHMKMAPKITLILGGLMLVGSIIAIAVGFGNTDLDGQEVFRGEAPTTWSDNLVWTSTYFIYVEEGSVVEVELTDGNIDNYYVHCSEDNTCSYYDNRIGYQYVGSLFIIDDGNYTVEFSGEGDVLVIETKEGGLFAAGLGGIFCCCAIMILVLGGILALTMKDDPVTQVVVMPGQVQAVPVAGVSPVPIGIDYSDPAQSYYANMMAQGFDSAQAAEITREQYPGFNQ